MNVAFDKWIPVQTISGAPARASLRDVFCEGSEFRDLAVRPHERVALMRLFTCAVHAALDGPKNAAEWERIPERLPSAAERYLEKWKDWFELFHETRPFLQIPGLSKSSNGKSGDGDAEGWTPVAKLNFAYALTLFDHSGMNKERRIPVEETLLSLLTCQCFSPGGTKTPLYWNTEFISKYSSDGPCIPSAMLHATLRGKDISETLLLNLPLYDEVELVYGGFAIGRPLWEQMPVSLSDIAARKNATESYLGRLVPLSRFVRFSENAQAMLFSKGYEYPSFANVADKQGKSLIFPPEPTATVKQKEKRYLSFRPEKAIWRELSPIVVKRSADDLGGPLFLRSLQNDQKCDIVICGIDRVKGNDVINDIVESVFAFSPKLRSDRGNLVYEAGVQIAERIGDKLVLAMTKYHSILESANKSEDKHVDGPVAKRKQNRDSKRVVSKRNAPFAASASEFYWTDVEHSLALLFDCVEATESDDFEAGVRKWTAALYGSARSAYILAASRQTSRQLRAFAEGWRIIGTEQRPDETNNDDNKENSK